MDKTQELLNQGNFLLKERNLEQAKKIFSELLELNPTVLTAYISLGAIAFEEGNIDGAITCNQIALTLYPTSIEALNNLGTAYFKLGDYHSSFQYLTKALDYAPGNTTVLNNISNLIQRSPEFSKKINKMIIMDILKQYKYGVPLDKISFDTSKYHAIAQYSFSVLELCDWEEFAAMQELLIFSTNKQLASNIIPGVKPLWGLIFFKNLATQKAIIRAHANIKPLINTNYTFKNKDYNKDKIVLGYISPDFYDHAVGFMLNDIFKHHNRTEFIIKAYSLYNKDGEYRDKISASVDDFIDVSMIDDKAIADKIHADKVDILIDLAGFTKNNRINVFSYNPAPVTASILGWSTTMGSKYIHYFITHKIMISDNMKNYMTEKLVYLPEAPWARAGLPDVPLPSKAEYGLPEDKLIFCCFNRSYRIDERVFTCWMRILKQVPDSILWLNQTESITQKNLINFAAKYGIAPERLIFCPRNSLSLTQHNRLADLYLDTFNLSAGTTNFINLWCGVPIISLLGDGPQSRIGAACLHAMQLDELIAKDEDEYINLAIELASNSDRMQSIKTKILNMRHTASLFNPEKFILFLEQAYKAMLKNFRSGKARCDIVINA